MIVVHVTHEAVEKIGGIGAVIAGLMNSQAYQKQVSRTILLGPLFETGLSTGPRLGPQGTVLYSSIDGVSSDSYEKVFLPVERSFDVRIVYGRRPVDDPCTGRVTEAEVLLVDVFRCNRDRLNVFKGQLSQKFGVHSEGFEKHWEYEQYVRLAEPGFEALRAIGCDGAGEPVVLLAHVYMGMPTALKAIAADAPNTRTVFYAHEVASVRPVVEDHPGHDTMFYNVMPQACQRGQSLEELFVDVQKNYKHPLVKAARHCDHVFAVGDYVEAELRFVDGHFKHVQIDRMYNGIPSERIDAAGKRASRRRMVDYAEKLLGYRPTWIFTHVCRPVRSKGLWRDLGVLHAMEPLLAARKETAAYFLLGTLGGLRRGRDIIQMERVYGWPVGHEVGYPDLSGGEEQLGGMVDHFNRDHEAVRAVFVNQWGWNRAACGLRMSEDMSFADIRRGTDVELGLSIYEPFGISQFEPLSFGALCVVSNVCGCMGFARSVVDGGMAPNIIEGDFVTPASGMALPALMALGTVDRDRIETAEAHRLAEIICQRLPRTDRQRDDLAASGAQYAERMSWDRVVQEYFLPSLSRTIE